MLALLRKILSVSRKIVIVIAVYFAVISLFTYFLSDNKSPSTYDPIKENRKGIYKNINDPKHNSTKEGRTMIAVYRLGMCGLIGEACTDRPSDGDKNFSSSLFGGVAKLIATPMGTPPASGTYWAYSGLEKSGFIPKTYAAEGVGFSGLKSFMDLWKLFRDAALLLLVVVLIGIGFLIMFRVKINPQTVITLENALPRIVVTLLLITFSFAIAGFMIDLMYLVTVIGISVLSKNTVYHIDAQGFYANLFGGGTGQLFDQILWNQNILEVGPAIFSILPAIV